MDYAIEPRPAGTQSQGVEPGYARGAEAVPEHDAGRAGRSTGTARAGIRISRRVEPCRTA